MCVYYVYIYIYVCKLLYDVFVSCILLGEMTDIDIVYVYKYFSNSSNDIAHGSCEASFWRGVTVGSLKER